MEESLLLKELKALLDESKKRGINVFVIGAFGVKAYDSLIRESHDLDLAVVSDSFEKLAQLLKDLGFSVRPKNIWVTAEKQIGDQEIDVHIAVDEILDLNSQNSFPLRHEKAVLLSSEQLGFEVPALSLYGLLITKLISFREKDIIDAVSILMEKADALNSQELYQKAFESNNYQSVQRRLNELREFFESGEIDAIWYIWLRRMLPSEIKAALLGKINKLLKPFTD